MLINWLGTRRQVSDADIVGGMLELTLISPDPTIAEAEADLLDGDD